MAKKLDDIMVTLPAQRRARTEGRAYKHSTLTIYTEPKPLGTNLNYT